MRKGTLGIGSASIVLVFAVLCLTIFTMITFTAVRNEKALTDAELELVKSYYAADVLAEQIFAQIISTDEIIDNINGIDIIRDFDTNEIIEFSCPISDKKELYIKASINEGSYDILVWRMCNMGTWDSDDGMPVWEGIEIDDGMPSMWPGE